MSLIEHQPTTDAPKPVKPKRIPRKIGEVIHLVATGECSTYKAAAIRVGMHPNYVYTALKKPEIVAHIEQQTRVILARLQAPAAATLARLMTDAKSESVQKDVAIHTLAIAGHKPRADAQVSVNLDIRAGFVIDLTDEPRTVQPSSARIAHTGHTNQVIDNAED